MGGGSSGGSSTNTTVQKADPWKGVQPYLKTGYQSLADLYGNPTYNEKGSLTGFTMGAGPQYYPGQTVASPNPLEAYGQAQMLGSTGQMQQLADASMYGLGGLFGGIGTANTGAAGGLGAMGGLGNLGNLYSTIGENMLDRSVGDLSNWANQSNTLGSQWTEAALGNISGLGGNAQTAGQDAYGTAMGNIGNMYNRGMDMSNAGLQEGILQLLRTGELSQFARPGIDQAMTQMGQFGGAGAQGLGMMGGAQGGFADFLNSGLSQAGGSGALQGMQGLLAAGDPMNNPYLASAMQAAIRPVTEQFTETVMPGIKQGAIGAGQMGSSRQGVAEGIASRGYQNTVGDITSQMGNQAYAQGLQAMQAGAGIGQGLLGQGLGATGQLGGLGQAMAQMGLGSAQGLGNLGMNAGQLGLGAGSSLGNLGQGMFGQVGGLQQALMGAGIDLTGMGMQGSQFQAGLGMNQQDRAAQMLQSIMGGGINVGGMGVGALTGAGGLGQGFYDAGMTTAGRGLAMTPQTMQSMLMPGQTAQQIGQQLTADQQAQINADIQRWNFQQQLPYSQISDYLSLLAGAPGGVTSSTMTGPGTQGSPLMGAAGGAMTGAGIGSYFGPWGTAAGALLGGALGYF